MLDYPSNHEEMIQVAALSTEEPIPQDLSSEVTKFTSPKYTVPEACSAIYGTPFGKGL